MLMALNQNRNTQNMANIKSIVQMIKCAGNPQMMFQQILEQNQALKEVMAFVQNNGGDSKALFYKLAEAKGVNPDDILNQLM